GRGQVDVGREEAQARHVRLHHDVVDVDVLLHQEVVDGEVERVGVGAEADGERALRVEVDQEDLAAVLGQRGAQVDRRGGLSHTAFLVRHGDDAGGTVALQGLGLGDVAFARVGLGVGRGEVAVRVSGRHLRRAQGLPLVIAVHTAHFFTPPGARTAPGAGRLTV